MAFDLLAHGNDQSGYQTTSLNPDAYEETNVYDIFQSLMDMHDFWRKSRGSSENHDLDPASDTIRIAKSQSDTVTAAMVQCWAYYYHSQAQMKCLVTASNSHVLTLHHLLVSANANEGYYDIVVAELEKVKAFDYELARRLHRGLLLMGTEFTIDLLEMAVATLKFVNGRSEARELELH